MSFTIGADPELVCRKQGQFISAHNYFKANSSCGLDGCEAVFEARGFYDESVIDLTSKIYQVLDYAHDKAPKLEFISGHFVDGYLLEVIHIFLFLKFLFEYSYLPRPFIINGDVKTRMPKGEPIIFDDKDTKKILDGLTKLEKNSNFKLMVKMLMFNGLRPSDIIGITQTRLTEKNAD